jgi:hypothetical protein
MVYNNKKKLLEEIKRKRKIVNFLIEASREDDDYGDEGNIQGGVYSDEDGFDDGSGKGKEGIQTVGPASQYDALVVSKSDLMAALNFLEDPQTNFEEKVKRANAKKAGNQKVNNERTLFYIMWLKGNRYWKSLWYDYLTNVSNNSQLWEINPDIVSKLATSEKEGKQITAADFASYTIPKKDTQAVARFVKFAKEFKKKVYSSLNETMTPEKFEKLLNQLRNQEVEGITKDAGYKDISGKYTKKMASGSTEDTYYKYRIVNRFLEESLGIDKSTGKPRPNSGVDLQVVDEVLETVTNDYNQIEDPDPEREIEIPDYGFDDATKKKIEKMSERELQEFLKGYEEDIDSEIFKSQKSAEEERIKWEEERGITRDEKKSLSDDEEITLLEKSNEYKKIINQLQIRINSTQFMKSDDFYKAAVELEKDLKAEDIELNEILELQNEYSITNLDRLEDFYKIYVMLNLTVMSMEKEIAEESEIQKIASGLDKFNRVKAKKKIRQDIFNEYSKKMNKFIDQSSDMIQAKIDKVAGAKYPDITKRLNFLKVSMEKYRSFINNKLHKSGTWTLQAIAGETGTYSDASGLQKHISRVLLQAMWVQNLLKSDKLSELKSLTLQKWIEIFDLKFGLSKAMEGSSYQDLVNKLQSLENENPQKFKSAKEKAAKNTLSKTDVILTQEEIENKVSEILSLDSKFLSMQQKIEDLYEKRSNMELEMENSYEIGDDDRAEMLNYEISNIDSEIYEISDDMQLYQERVIKKIKDEQSNLENNQDDDFSKQIIDIENQLTNAPSMKPFSYEMTGKGKTAKYEEKPFEKIGNIEDEEFTPSNIFNKNRLAEPSAEGVKLTKDWQDAIKAYVNQGTRKEQDLYSSKDEIYRKRLLSQKLNVKIDPKFISKMLEDKFSPYRQFHNMLVGDYFDSARSYSQSIKNENGIRQAIIEWFHQNYNDSWLPNGLRSSKSPAGLKEGSNPADDDIWNEIVNYAIGLANCKYDEKNLRIVQNEKDQVDDLMKKYEKGGWDKVMTPPDVSKPDLDDIRLSIIARRRFFEKLVTDASFMVDYADPRQKIKPKGSISAAVLKDLYSPNFINAFKQHIDSLPEKDLTRMFDDSIKHVEFYQQYPGSVIDPADYIKARKL